MHNTDIILLIAITLLLVLIFYAVKIRSHIQTVFSGQNIKSKEDRIWPLKLQALERFMLFAERIDPMNLLTRVPILGKTAYEYRRELVSTIQDEYNYNSAWQLYLSDSLALQLKHLVSEAILTINIASDNLHEGASAIDLSKKIVARHADGSNNIYFKFQSSLRKHII